MRRPKKAGLIFAALAVTTASASSAAEDRPLPPITTPASRGSGDFLGPWLEGHFQKMMMSCSPTGSRLQVTKVKKDSPTDVSAVPKSLRISLSLTDADRVGRKIAVHEGRSMIYLFGNVYAADQIATLAIPNGSSYLNVVRDDAPDFVAMPRVNSAFLVQTCATAMNAALEANAGYTIPVVSLKGGLAADYSADSTFSLNLTNATFQSPLLVAYTGPDTPSQSQFNAAMTMVEWYVAHPDRRGTGNFLLKSFEGVALYEQAGLKRNTTLAASASARGGIPLIATASSSLEASAKWFTDFRASNYSVAIFRDDNGSYRADTLAMPSLDAVVARASATGAFALDREKSGDDFTLYDRSTRTLYFIANRLPPTMCGPGWRMTSQPADPTLTMGAAIPGQAADGWPVCRIPVTFRPAQDMGLVQDHVVSVSFELTITGREATPKVVIAAEPVTFRPLRYPHLARTGSDVRPVVASTERNGVNVRTALLWKSQYQLTDNNLLADNAVVDLSGLTSTCTPVPSSADWIEPTRVLTVRTAGAARVAELVLQMAWNGDFAASQGSVSYIPCTLSGSIAYTLKSGQLVSKDFPDLRFEYPVVKPQG